MALSKTFAQYKVKDIHSSHLWAHMKNGNTKSKVMDVLIVPTSDLKVAAKKGTREWRFQQLIVYLCVVLALGSILFASCQCTHAPIKWGRKREPDPPGRNATLLQPTSLWQPCHNVVINCVHNFL